MPFSQLSRHTPITLRVCLFLCAESILSCVRYDGFQKLDQEVRESFEPESPEMLIGKKREIHGVQFKAQVTCAAWRVQETGT